MAEKNPPQILIDCHGVGYEVWVPMSTFYNLPALGEKLVLLTHFVVREDAQLLYGFGSEAERAAFRELIKISGIGPRMALAVLSGMGVADLARRKPARLSGGELQRVALPRALLLRPPVILADEPTASLDDAACAAALALLQACALEGGASLVIATHDARVGQALPDTQVLSLAKGAP